MRAAVIDLASFGFSKLPLVRDAGLLGSALARPQASAFGEDAYSGLYEKAATIAFGGMNGIRPTLASEEAYDLVISVAAGTLDHVPRIAAVLESHSASRAR